MATRESSSPCPENPLLSVLDTAPATDRLDQLEQQLLILPTELAPALPTPTPDGSAGPEGARRGPAPAAYVAQLADPLTMPITPIRDRGVFVDDSGRRKLWMRTAGWVAAALSAAYVGVLGVTAISTAIGPQNTPAPAPALAPETATSAAPPPATSAAPPPPPAVVKPAPPKPVVKPAAPPRVSVTPAAKPPASAPPTSSKPPTKSPRPSTRQSSSPSAPPPPPTS